MDVRCPQCQTLYELDADQVGARSVTLKCSQCQHVFRLEGRQAVAQENQRRWMIRRAVEGDVLYLNTFDALHEWIMRRDVTQDDEISRTGEKWVTLGSIGEFMPMFQVVESISRIEGDTTERNDISSIAIRRPGTPQPAPVPEARERVRTSIQYGGSAPSPAPSPEAEEPTKNERPSRNTPHDLPPGPPDTDVPAVVPPPNLRSDEDAWDVDLSTEAETSGTYPSQQKSSSRGTLVFVGILSVAAVGGYFAFTGGLFDEPKSDVVTIGATTTGAADQTAEGVEPRAAIDSAIEEALRSADEENDAIWTMWHETASEPFYVALDTAYAAADEASADVELEDTLRDARTALENGRLAEASKLFGGVLAKDPDNPAATTGLGWALLESGRTNKAAERFQASVNADPNYGDAYIGLGTAYRQLGEPRKAYDAYDLYLGRFPKGEKASIAAYQVEQLKKQLGM